MTRSISAKRRRTPIFLCVLIACAHTTPSHAGCWSVLASPKWAEIEGSLGRAKLCEVLPAGPNRTARMSIKAFDVCDVVGGVRFHAEASLDCKSSDDAIFKTKATASVSADVSIDIGTCSVTDARVQVGGAIGSALAARPEMQNIVKQLAQRELSKLCGKP